MEYLEQNDPNLLKDLSKRKEFYQYTHVHQPEIDKSKQLYDLDEYRQNQIDVNIEFQNYQSNFAAFINPLTPYARGIEQWEPGMGKTLAALGVAKNFIDLYQKEAEIQTDVETDVGSVFIIGFTEDIFKKELLSYPYFGYVTREEVEHKRQLEQAVLANENDRIAADRLQDYMIKLKKRLTNRKERGFFRFFGYKAFVNRIFMLSEFKLNINDLTEDEIKQRLRDGSLKFNDVLLKSFRNSLIICDEIHVVYNSQEKNNWGVAIQMVLDNDPTIKAIFLSATLLNTSPTEIIDLANFMQPPNAKLRKEDFFDGNQIKSQKKLEEIAAVFRGRVSYIQDSNPDHFASQEIVGETIKGIDYLKFIRCPMTTFHYKTYKQVYSGVLAQDAQYLMDIAFPNPEGPNEPGLYKTSDIKRALSFVSDKWYQEFGFKYQNDTIIGHGMLADNLKHWSNKMWQVLKDTQELLKDPHSGKTLIYHDVVHVSGVIFLEQIFQNNGFIGIDQSPTEDTLCAVCGIAKRDHPPDVKPASFKEITELKHKGLPPPPMPDNNLIFAMSSSDDLRSSSGDLRSRKNTKGGKSDAWQIVAPSTSSEIDAAKEFYCSTTGLSEPHFIIAPCTTRIITDEKQKPIALLSWVEEDSQVWRIEALVIDNDHFNQGIEEYLLQTCIPEDKIATVIVLADDKNTKKWWLDRGFKQHDEDLSEGIVFLSYEVGSSPTSDSPFFVNKDGGAASKSQKEIKPHLYVPARYIVAHSDMDKGDMFRHIDRFNAPDNLWGYKCRVIIGSKIIKQSYNFKAIRHVKVTARPSNIATFIQIIGRARRKDAHLLLPKKLWNIEIKIYTSSLPDGNLSHEEIKYKEKIEDYKVIQELERQLHMDAIDSVMARDIIKTSLNKPGSKGELGALWFEPSIPVPQRRYTLKDLNLNTFIPYHSDNEVRLITYIIKRIYITQSAIYTLEQLWDSVKSPPFHVEQDTSLFQYENFIIALSQMIYGSRDEPLIRPSITTNDNVDADDNTLNLLDLMHSDVDKRIMMPSGTVGYIHHIDNYYIYIPFRDGRHDMYAESPFRSFLLHSNKPINISRYVKEASKNIDYSTQRTQFYLKYEKVPLDKLSSVIGKFGTTFHQMFVEEIITYVFNLWTNPTITLTSEMHDFYFKMLYYYDIMGLIIWASGAKDFILKDYSNYLLPNSISKSNDKTIKIPGMSSLSRSLGQSVNQAVSTKDLAESLALTAKLINNRQKQGNGKKPTNNKYAKQKEVPIVKADPNQLPIGHFISSVPRFYLPEKEWYESTDYVQQLQEFKENDILIGYYEKSQNGLNVKFKIRPPLQKIQHHKDSRLVEKGSVCSSNNKADLIEIAKQLKIPIPPKVIVPHLCEEIEVKLQMNEIEERRKKTNIKWFYSFWEPNPQSAQKYQSSSASSS
jgi:hypothetical protein